MRTQSITPPMSPHVSESQGDSKSLTRTVKPSKTLILPSSACNDARFLQLPNPRTGNLTRYYFCPKLGLYEFTVVVPPSHHPRSILFTRGLQGQRTSGDNQVPTEGFISRTAELLVATPIDILFFMIPMLSTSHQSMKLFQPLDSIIYSQDGLSQHMRYILHSNSFRDAMEARAEAVCETLEVGDEKAFRFSEEKLLRELIAKAERMVTQGIPGSMEERFIRQALVTPMMAMKCEDPTTNRTSSDSIWHEDGSRNEEAFSTDSGVRSLASASDEGTPATEPMSDIQPPQEHIIHLLRISTALSLIKKSYLSQLLSDKIDSMLAAPESPIDFRPLNERLRHIAGLRAEALVSKNLGDFNHKRELGDDIEELRGRKKRRQKGEENEKAGKFRGGRNMKRTDTSGMKKMSDFFSKVPTMKP